MQIRITFEALKQYQCHIYFKNHLDKNFGPWPGCHFFLNSLEVILYRSQGCKPLTNAVFLKRKFNFWLSGDAGVGIEGFISFILPRST